MPSRPFQVNLGSVAGNLRSLAAIQTCRPLSAALACVVTCCPVRCPSRAALKSPITTNSPHERFKRVKSLDNASRSLR
eukprot:1151226-Rhodomonas_salina.1